MVTRTSQDPSKLEANIEHFKSEVMPRIASGGGFLALRNLVDRSTGAGVVGTVWADKDAMETAMTEAEARRGEAMARGVTFQGTSFREVILIHQP
jgi:hypothetical protein